jgi:hypothetical protein
MLEELAEPEVESDSDGPLFEEVQDELASAEGDDEPIPFPD